MQSRREHPGITTALAWLVIAGVVLVPLAFVYDSLDRFHVIKESITRAEALVGLLLLVAAAAFGSTDRLRAMLGERMVVAVVAAGVAWAVITTALSTHRLLSIESLVTVLTSALVFLIAWHAAPRVSLVVLLLLVPVVLVNVVVQSLQEYGIYQPFRGGEDLPLHLRAVALIGNPNVVGTYMALVAILLAAAATAVQGWRRWLCAFGGLVASAGVIVSGTRTAVIALVVGLVVLALHLSLKYALVTAVALVVLFGIAAAQNVAVVERILELPKRFRAEGLETVTSGRGTPALAAWLMFRDHPLSGVGPGAFRYHYMDYQIRARAAAPELLRGHWFTNYGEAHNDHLQILAEGGLLGYVLFLAGVFVVIRQTRRSDADDARAAVARRVAIPAAATFLVLCLAQFPLYIAVSRHLLVTMAGLLVGWSRRWP